MQISGNELTLIHFSGPAQYESTWDEFFVQIGNISERVPYMVNPGTHDYPYKYFRMTLIQVTLPTRSAFICQDC